MNESNDLTTFLLLYFRSPCMTCMHRSHRWVIGVFVVYLDESSDDEKKRRKIHPGFKGSRRSLVILDESWSGQMIHSGVTGFTVSRSPTTCSLSTSHPKKVNDSRVSPRRVRVIRPFKTKAKLETRRFSVCGSVDGPVGRRVTRRVLPSLLLSHWTGRLYGHSFDMESKVTDPIRLDPNNCEVPLCPCFPVDLPKFTGRFQQSFQSSRPKTKVLF